MVDGLRSIFSASQRLLPGREILHRECTGDDAWVILQEPPQPIFVAPQRVTGITPIRTLAGHKTIGQLLGRDRLRFANCLSGTLATNQIEVSGERSIWIGSQVGSLSRWVT